MQKILNLCDDNWITFVAMLFMQHLIFLLYLYLHETCYGVQTNMDHEPRNELNASK